MFFCWLNHPKMSRGKGAVYFLYINLRSNLSQQFLVLMAVVRYDPTPVFYSLSVSKPIWMFECALRRWHLLYLCQQCEQIWPNFATVVKYFKCLGNFWYSLFSIRHYFAPTLAIFMLLGIFSLLQIAQDCKIT